MKNNTGTVHTEALYLVNDKTCPARYGRVKVTDRPTRATVQHRPKRGVLCRTVATGFCGSDLEYLSMARRLELSEKFPAGKNRLIIGHEGVIYVPGRRTYALLLVRGSSDADPTRYGDGHTLFEHGCHKKDGIMCQKGFYNPDMIIPIPQRDLSKGMPMSLSLAKRLIFADPYACSLFLKERVEDIAMGHNYRLYLKEARSSGKACRIARDRIFDRTVIFGYGAIGLLVSIILCRSVCMKKKKIIAVGRSSPDVTKVRFLEKMTQVRYVQAKGNAEEQARAIIKALGGRATLFIAASGNDIESKIAFDEGVLGNNGIYSSFSAGPSVTVDSMKFGFQNHLMYGAINFRRDHMEKAARDLPALALDGLVKVCPLEELKGNPTAFIENVFAQDKDYIKSMVVWDKELILQEDSPSRS